MSGADDSELVQHNTLIYNRILILLVLAELKVLRINWKQFSAEGTLTYSSASLLCFSGAVLGSHLHVYK